jgi:subtilisin family serine protease
MKILVELSARPLLLHPSAPTSCRHGIILMLVTSVLVGTAVAQEFKLKDYAHITLDGSAAPLDTSSTAPTPEKAAGGHSIHFPNSAHINYTSQEFAALPCGAPIPGSYFVRPNLAAQQLGSTQLAQQLANIGAQEDTSFPGQFTGLKLFKVSHQSAQAEHSLRQIFGENLVHPNRKICSEDRLRGQVNTPGLISPNVLVSADNSGGFEYMGPQISAYLGSPLSAACPSGASLRKVFVSDGYSNPDGLADALGLVSCTSTGESVLATYCNHNNDLPSYSLCKSDRLGINIDETQGDLRDMNGDGAMDLVAIVNDQNVGFSIRIFHQLATSTSVQNSIFLPLSFAPYKVLVEDLNNDGRLDIVVVLATSPNLSLQVYLNQGGGNFQNFQTFPLTLSAIDLHLKKTDYNLDGRPDLALFATSTTSAYISFFVQLPNGQFANGTVTPGNPVGEDIIGLASTNFVFNRDAQDLVVGDLNNDNLEDYILVAAEGSDARLLYIPHTGDGNNPVIGAGVDSFQMQAGKILLDDYDDDGDRDIYVANRGGNLGRFRNFFAESGTSSLSNILSLDTSLPDLSYTHNLTSTPPRAVIGATVQARNVSTGQIYSVTSDKYGFFDFNPIPLGNYQVGAARDLYKSPGEVNIGVIGTVSGVNVPLLKAPPYALPLPNPLPSTWPSDQGMSHLWGLHNYGQSGGTNNIDVDAPEAWTLSSGSHNVVVGVLDTGIDYTHQDLAPNMWSNPGEIPNNNVDDDSNGLVDDVHGYSFVNNNNFVLDYFSGHGTHVAGTIGAVGNNGIGVSGVNQNVRLMAIQVLSTVAGSGSDASILGGLSYALTMKLRTGQPRVLNLSLGSAGNCPEPYKQLLEALNENGVFVTFAAGNDGTNNDVFPQSPPNCKTPNSVAVAALDRNGQLADFSNFGATTVEVAAPGVDIWSTFPGNGYKSNQGTSMAAPHVAGVAAAVLSREPNLSASELRVRLLSTIKPLLYLTGRLSYPGIVSAKQAMDANPSAPTNPPPGSNPNPTPTSTNQTPAIKAGTATLKSKKGKFPIKVKLSGFIVSDADGAIVKVVATVTSDKLKKNVTLKQQSNGTYTGTATLKLSKGKSVKKFPSKVGVVVLAEDNAQGTTSQKYSLKLKKAK